jgi:tetratricopeptide (TPR) repeat protein
MNTLPVYTGELGDHPWTASILNFIAGSYKVLATERSEHGYAEQAEMYFRQALELRRRLLGFHQDTARSHVSLSDVLVILGNSQSALDELEKALEIQKDVLGPQHKNTTDTSNKKTDLETKMGCKYKGNVRK